MATDRLDDRNTRRTVTDRVGGNVVLGNSITESAFEMTASMTNTCASASTAAAAIVVAASASLTMFNGSFGTVSGESSIPATANAVWSMGEVHSGAVSGAGSASFVSAGGNISAAWLDSSAVSELLTSADRVAQITITSTANFAGAAIAAGAPDSTSAGTLALGGVVVQGADVTLTAAAAVNFFGPSSSEWSATQTASVTFAGEADATSAFDLNATAALTGVYVTYFDMSGQGSLTASGAGIASAAATMSATASLSYDANIQPYYMQASATLGFGGEAVSASAMSYLAGVGYVSGGFIPSYSATTTRFRFADESVSSAVQSLSVGRAHMGSAQSSTHGYVGGGRESVAGDVDTIEYMTFSSEELAPLSAVLTTARRLATGVSGTSRGYFCGGLTASNSSEIDGVVFSDHSATNPSATLSVARRGCAGVYSSTKGYVCGGYSSSYLTEIDGIRFSDETAINPAATLATARYTPVGSYSDTHGYVSGGSNSGGKQTEIDGIRFSDESAVNPSAALGTGVDTASSLSSFYAGYTCAGEASTGSVNTIQKFDFTLQTATTISSVMNVNRRSAIGYQNKGTQARADLTVAGTTA